MRHRLSALAIGCATLILPALTDGPARSAAFASGQPARTAVPVDEARAMALHAMESGLPELAVELALAMLHENPEDSFAHLVMATLMMQSGHLDKAMPAARRAFRYSESPRQKHESARMAALIAARQDRFLPAQIWMRRALQSASSDVTRARSVHEFRALRREARLRLDFSGSVVPSSNVNNGTANRFNVVDGLPIVGILPPTSQALSGLVTSGSARASYRVHRDEHSETRVFGGLQARTVELSEEAREKAPTAENADFASSFAEIGLHHVQVLGEGEAFLSGNFSYGQVWKGGEKSHDLLRGGARISVQAAKNRLVSFGLTGQRTYNDVSGLADVDTIGLRLALGQTFGNGDRLTASVGLTMASSDNKQARSQEKRLTLAYERSKPLGPVSLSASLSYAETDFPDYRILFFDVPGGRQDQHAEARIDVKVDKMSYAGFVPTISFASEATESNVSRFTTEQFSISLGIASEF